MFCWVPSMQAIDGVQSISHEVLLGPPAAVDEDATRRKGCASRLRRDALIGPCPRVLCFSSPPPGQVVWFLLA